MSTPHPVAFDREKYGPERLVDVAWIREIPTFILDRAHTLGFYEIVLITRGQGWVWLDGYRYRVRPGRVIFTSPGQLRRWRTMELDGVSLLFPALFLEEFFHDRLFLHRLPYLHRSDRAALTLASAASARLRRRLLGMRAELLALHADGTHLLRAALYEVLVTLARQYDAAHGVKTGDARAPHPIVAAFGELVRRDAARRHDVASYARELAVTPGYLSTLCARHLGVNAKAIITEALTLEARRMLLYADDSAARVGHALGFEDPSYFTRFFRRATGHSPTEFRTALRPPSPPPAPLRAARDRRRSD